MSAITNRENIIKRLLECCIQKRGYIMTVSVVTGGAGFLGSHLCDRLLADGHNVICIDNLITGSISNIAHLTGNDRFKFIKHDVTEYIYLDCNVDYVFHFASPASPIDYLRFPIQTLKVGAIGTHKALGLARAKKAVFVLASTSEVYGDPAVHPQPESYWGNVNPVGLRGVYDEAKRFAEAMTMAYHRVHGLNVKIVRIFNTYGPRMRANDGRAVPTFIKQAISNEPLTIFGNGTQTRSLCYVSDLIEGIWKFAQSKETGPLNLGNPEEMSIIELARKIISLTNSSSELVFCPLPEDDPKIRQPDIKLARQKLNWNPVVTIDKGLILTIEYFRNICER